MNPVRMWKWIRQGDCTPKWHWIVHIDYRRDRYLAVVFPLNFFASAYFIAKRIKWEFEEWLVKMERKSNETR